MSRGQIVSQTARSVYGLWICRHPVNPTVGGYYEAMTNLENEILVREIGKLAGFFGGFGARAAARRLPVEQYEIKIEVPLAAGEVRIRTSQVLRSLGVLVDDFALETEPDTLSAVVGSGHMNLNPTIVHVQFVGASDNSSQLAIKGIAKEGIVKQDSARKAVERIIALLSDKDAHHITESDR